MVVYADFFTMAAIASTQVIGIINQRKTSRRRSRLNRFPSVMSFVICIVIWALSFLLISPAVFEMTFGHFTFGLGWDKANGRCEVLDCNHLGGLKAGGIINICGVIAPFVIISVSYLSISLFVRRETKQISTVFGRSESQVENQEKTFELKCTFPGQFNKAEHYFAHVVNGVHSLCNSYCARRAWLCQSVLGDVHLFLVLVDVCHQCDCLCRHLKRFSQCVHYFPS